MGINIEGSTNRMKSIVRLTEFNRNQSKPNDWFIHSAPGRMTWSYSNKISRSNRMRWKGQLVSISLPIFRFTQILTKFTCQVYFKQQKHVSLHASRSNICPYHASRINPSYLPSNGGLRAKMFSLIKQIYKNLTDWKSSNHSQLL